MEEDISPCKRSRCNYPFSEFRDEEIPERNNTAQPKTPPNDESKNLNFDLECEKNEPRMIVLALCAPKQIKIQNPGINNAKSRNLDPVIHWKEVKRRRQLRPCSGGCCGGAATTAASVYKITGISCCCFNLFLQNGGRRMSGCAVISKGIVVVEGEISCIRRYLELMLKEKEEKSDSVKVIWQGKVAKPSFGKFSILHCSSEVAIFKFFAAHGASHYWDLAVKSNLN